MDRRNFIVRRAVRWRQSDWGIVGRKKLETRQAETRIAGIGVRATMKAQ